jgi:recombination protein RecA
MPIASAIRLQIEADLAKKIPSALTPLPKMIRPVVGTGIESLDDLLRGGLPVGALSELTGPECSGRTSVALSFIARMTEANRVCAWIDVSNAFDPASAAAVGVNLKNLLWVRCGVRQTETARVGRRFVLPQKYFVPHPIKKGLHGGGFGPHPRTEVRGLSDAVGDLLHQDLTAPRCAEPQHRPRPQKESSEPSLASTVYTARSPRRAKQFDAIEQGVRSADLLLQTGGFSAIVLDLASIRAEFVARIELSTWHRYRLAAERTQSTILLLTQYSCAKSSSELQLRLLPADEIGDETTIFTGMEPHVEVARQRFTETENSNVVPLRKPPQNAHTTTWNNRTTWAVQR